MPKRKSSCRKTRQECIAACPEDIREPIQMAIERAFLYGRHEEGDGTPYYKARDQALYLIGKLILMRKAELEAMERSMS